MALPDGPHCDLDSDTTRNRDYHCGEPLHKTEEPQDGSEHDGTNLMQTGVRLSWEEMLANLQHDLEMLPKPQRAEAVVQLLRWLDYRATDKEQGYLLGHMRGRTADLTALLVAALDDTQVDASTITGPWCSSWVLETRRRLMEFIPCHEGSHEGWGKPMETGMPCIMLFGRPPPTSTPPSSPGLSAVVDLEEEEEHGEPSKRRCLAVELSSGSGDAPRLARTIRMPFPGDVCSFQVNVRVEETDESEATTMIGQQPACPRQDRPSLTGFRLPEPAPGDLAASGISMSEFMGLWTGWKSGSICYEDIARVYGNHAAQLAQRLWSDLPAEAYTNPTLYPQEQNLDVEPAQSEVMHATQQQDPHLTALESQTERTPDHTKETLDDEAALLTVVMRLLPALQVLAPEVPVVCELTAMQLASNWIRRLRQQGLENVVITSCLLNYAQARADGEYMQDWEDILLELGLEVEGDQGRTEEVPHAVSEMLQWVEAEMWEDYVDRLEGLVGWESQQVANAREVANMHENVRGEWRQRAAAGDMNLDLTVPTTGRRVRPRRAQGQAEEGGSEGDAQSLMERPHRHGERGRDDSRGAPERRGRDARDARGSSRRGMDTEEERTRSRPLGNSRPSRCTEEVRRLEPRRPHTPRLTPTTTRSALPTLSVDAATARWLHFLNLRPSPTTTSLEPALPQEGRQERIDWLGTLHEQDMAAAMAGLMRVLAMLMVECSHMLVTHQAAFLVSVDLEEEDDEETIYMQQGWTTAKRRKTDDGPTEEDLRAEHEERVALQRERAARDQQQQEREREEIAWEAEQEKLATQLYAAHEAARYRDWEQWEVLHAVSAVPKRQHLRIVAEAMGPTEASSSSTTPSVQVFQCELPRLRQGGFRLTLEMGEVGRPVAPTAPTVPERPEAPSTTTSNRAQPDEDELDTVYKVWSAGGCSDSEVRANYGDEIMTGFLAQWLSEQDDMEGDDTDEEQVHETQCQDEGIRTEEDLALFRGNLDRNQVLQKWQMLSGKAVFRQGGRLVAPSSVEDVLELGGFEDAALNTEFTRNVSFQPHNGQPVYVSSNAQYVLCSSAGEDDKVWLVISLDDFQHEKSGSWEGRLWSSLGALAVSPPGISLDKAPQTAWQAPVREFGMRFQSWVDPGMPLG
ncbi:pol [Symbiodinium sp. CCMP2456]|nr:pol [Symbiodinium sp. CCMP2456]